MWAQLSATKPHIAYALIGGFVTIFSLVSLFVKERLYIGEATVAMIVGIIFGPVAAGIFDPYTWGNTDYITLEVARIVIVVQVFAVGVELPKKYLKNHWKGVAVMLLPVMFSSWLICAGFIYALIPKLHFVESLVVAATLAPTDPVLASSVVGKGKFAERVPGHIRNLLSCESGCNDGMAFPFLYLGLYIILDVEAGKTTKEWILITILYECLFGIVLGVIIGYGARRAIRFAEDKKLIDRESFLVFYFVLALFCAGIGTVIGVDDFLVAFSAGATFAWDGWFTKKTEESHVSNVIDLLLNMAFFVYFGAIIPWSDFSSPDLSITPWRLVVLAILILLFRRIPGVFACYKICPDIRNWREALFCGHFGPIGVGALFFSILARAELETESQVPAGRLPGVTEEHGVLIGSIYPIVTFIVLSSIVVHGSSVAVFTLGKHINTNVLPTISMTFTRGHSEDGGPSWLQRLPRLEMGQSMTFSKSRERSRSRDPNGGHIDKSAIGSAEPPRSTRRRGRNSRRGRSHSPNEHKISEKDQDRHHTSSPDEEQDQRTKEEIEASQQYRKQHGEKPESGDAHYHEEGQEIYREGDEFIVEDELGEVIRVVKDPKKLSQNAAHNLLDKKPSTENMSRDEREAAAHDVGHPQHHDVKDYAVGLSGHHDKDSDDEQGSSSKTSKSSSTADDKTLTRNSSAEDSPDNVDKMQQNKNNKARQSKQRQPNNDEETPAEQRRRLHALGVRKFDKNTQSAVSSEDEGEYDYGSDDLRDDADEDEDEFETPAERKRRLQALGHSVEERSRDTSPAPQAIRPSASRTPSNGTPTTERQPRISFHASVEDGSSLRQPPRSNPNVNSSSSLQVPSPAHHGRSTSRGRSIVWADHSASERELASGDRAPSRERTA